MNNEQNISERDREILNQIPVRDCSLPGAPADRAVPSPKDERRRDQPSPFARRPGSLSRSILPLLFLLSFVARSGATPVVGSLTDVNLQPINTAMTFTPTNDTFIFSFGIGTGPAVTIWTTNPVTGGFSNNFAPGPYVVSLPLVPWRRGFQIVIPDTTNVVQFSNTFNYPRWFVDGRALQLQVDALNDRGLTNFDSRPWTNTASIQSPQLQAALLIVSGAGTNLSIYYTNIVTAVSTEDTNNAYLSGAGSAVANAHYRWMRNLPDGFIMTNILGGGFLVHDRSGLDLEVGEENPYYVGPTTNNDHTAWYFSAVNERVYWQYSSDTYGAMAGIAPAPTFSYGTNTVLVTNTVLIQSGLINQLAANKTLLVDQANGNDTAAAYSLCPYKTLTAAKNAATAGTLILVRPGIYAEHNLAKNGVNWKFMDGAPLMYDEPDWGDGIGIFDDRASGAITSNIEGDFIHYSSTSPIFSAPIVVTNSNTHLHVKFKKGDSAIYLDPANDSGVIGVSFGTEIASVVNCRYADITIDEVGNFTSPATTQMIDRVQSQVDGTYGTLIPVSQTTGGFYWANGEEHIHTHSQDGSTAQYFLWVDAPASVTNDISVYYDADETSGLFYGDGASTSARTWVTIRYAKGQVGSTAFRIYGKSLYYITTQKTGSKGVLTALDSDSGSWYLEGHFGKVSASQKWFDIRGTGQHFIDFDHLEDGGAVQNGIDIFAGTNVIKGGYAMTSNGPILHLTGGQADVSGLRMDTSLGTNQPVVVSATGLMLRNCLLVSGSTNAIYSPTSKQVGFLAVMGNKTNSSNVVPSPGTNQYIFDANLK